MVKSLKTATKIHFVGVGGIGISAVARMLLGQGKQVSGSDRDSSLVTAELVKLGAKITIGHQTENIPTDCDLVIYSNAIGEDNLELIEAEKRGLLMLSYPEAVGQISAEKYTIAIAGTHGKTTTTAMTAEALIAGVLDPTVIVGSLLKLPNGETSNFIAGQSEYLVIEADEYKRAFLNLTPKILAITNLDLDHLDYYKGLADIQNAFGDLVGKIPSDGFLICDQNDPHLLPVLSQANCQVINYQTADISGLNLLVPGEHNRDNAKVAIAIGEVLKINRSVIVAALNKFSGTWRRFEYKGKTAIGALVYDDYAHNPQKVKAALAGAREKFPDQKVVAIFQPHLFSRTKLLLKDFGQSFADADLVGILDIYPAREAFDDTIHSRDLVAEINQATNNAVYLKDFAEAENWLKTNSKEGDVIMTIGAGDGYKIGEAVLVK